MSGNVTNPYLQIAKWIRAILSLTVIALAIIKFRKTGLLMWLLVLVGVAFLISAFSSTCPTCPATLRFRSARPDQEDRRT